MKDESEGDGFSLWEADAPGIDGRFRFILHPSPCYYLSVVMMEERL